MNWDIFMVLLPGMGTSLLLWAAVMVLGVPLGLVLGYALHEGAALVRIPVAVLTQIGRGFPALVTLYLVYFGLPDVGLTFSAQAALIAAFTFTTGSYLAEVFRSALAAVPIAQHEAARALGVPWRARMLHVVLPQALRVIWAPVLGFAIIVLQGTSLAYSVGVRELLGVAYSEGTVTFQVFDYLVAAGVLYLASYLLLTWTAALVKRRTTNTGRAAAPPADLVLPAR